MSGSTPDGTVTRNQRVLPLSHILFLFVLLAVALSMALPSPAKPKLIPKAWRSSAEREKVPEATIEFRNALHGWRGWRPMGQGPAYEVCSAIRTFEERRKPTSWTLTISTSGKKGGTTRGGKPSAAALSEGRDGERRTAKAPNISKAKS